jgi:hypothetical protein
MSYFGDDPAHRNSDPDTSRSAKRYGLTEDRKLAVKVHARHPHGLTDYELAGITGKQQNSIGKRRTEMLHCGYVEDSGLRRPNPSTNSGCIVWRITSTGLTLARFIERTEIGL